MSELNMFERAQQDACVPNVQGRLSMHFVDDPSEPDGHDGASLAPVNLTNRSQRVIPGSDLEVGKSRISKLVADQPPPYRSVVAGWPDYWRERWGYRANALEETGLNWRDAETQAFVEMLNRIREDSDRRIPVTVSVPETSANYPDIDHPSFDRQSSSCT